MRFVYSFGVRSMEVSMNERDLKQYFEILEIEPTDSLDFIKQVYEDLVYVWNPDRFADDPDLQHKAIVKIKKINNAYDFLCEILKPNNIDTLSEEQDEPYQSKAEQQATTMEEEAESIAKEEKIQEQWFENLGIIVVIVFFVLMILGIDIISFYDNNINNPSPKTYNLSQKTNIPPQNPNIPSENPNIPSEKLSNTLHKPNIISEKLSNPLHKPNIPLQRPYNSPPQTADDYYNRGDYYFNLKDYQQAIKDYSKAIELNPKYANAYYSRGSSYSIVGNVQQAIADYKIAASLGDKYIQDLLSKNGISW